ncbi:MAG: starvation-inducible DNA-binding protein [Mariniblastus sp.]
MSRSDLCGLKVVESLTTIRKRTMSISAPGNHSTTVSSPSEITNGLSRVLADTYSVYLKTQNYHWNVKGPLFHTLHAMFEVQYTELAVAIDEIAERIRALGEPAPGSFTEFAKLSRIKEETGLPTAETMISNLIEDQSAIVQTCKNVFPLVQQANDEPTADLLIRRMQIHEKTAWMLRSLTE